MYCIKCGAQIPDGAKLCANCQQQSANQGAAGPQGQPGPGQGQTQAGEKGTYRLTVTRQNQFYLVNPAIKVMIDGMPRLSIENGGMGWIDLPAGVHMFTAKCSFRKKEFGVNMCRDVTVVLSWNRLTGEIEAETLY